MTAPTDGLPSGYRLVAITEIDSTNRFALERAHRGEGRDGDVIWAERQTAGRGRLGRCWQSPEGNLFVTVLVGCVGPLGRSAQIGFIAALAVRDALLGLPTASGVPAVTCKWPNDILIGGCKVAGILLEVAYPLEADATLIAVGVGLNLVHRPENTRFPATCVRDAFNLVVCPWQMVGAVIGHFDHWRRIREDKGFPLLRKAWLESAHGLGEPVTVRMADRELSGRFGGLDESGALLLGTPDGSLAISAGDVHFPDVLRENRG